MMPVTVVKVRFESNQYNYHNLISAFSSIARNEGFRGLFSGFGATAMRDAPFAGIYIVFYERCKSILSRYPLMQNNMISNSGYSFELLPKICAGLIGGFGATLCTQPFDLVKSRIQLSPKEYPNTFLAFKTILKDQGKIPHHSIDNLLKVYRVCFGECYQGCCANLFHQQSHGVFMRKWSTILLKK
jgi:solute carrier family 25 protein 38